MNSMFGINNLLEGSYVSPLQGFYSNIKSISLGFVTLHPVLIRAGALPQKNQK